MQQSLDEKYHSEFVKILATNEARTQSGIKDVYREVQKKQTEAKREAERKAREKAEKSERERLEAEEEARQLKEREDWFNKYVHLFHKSIGDITSEDIPDKSVSLIFTDPPYDRESIHLYETLAKLGARILEPGGSLITYAGHYAIPEILPLMQKHMRFWWINAISHSAGNKSFPGKNIQVGWKPLLWFVKENRNTSVMVRDLIKSENPKKDLHEWQQSCKESDYYIRKLTKEDDIVCDPS